jgi:phosphoglucosamine mutase
MNPPPNKIFGTDGVRGKANVEPITAETALKLGRAAAHVFKNLNPESRSRQKHQIVIGKDTRLSGYMLENALSSGILSMGVDVLFIGPLPTPGVARITNSLRADAGIVITASHNPYDDNGIKFFSHDGYKLADSLEEQIENLVFSGEIDNVRPTAEAIGKAIRIDDALGRYVEYAKRSFPRGKNLEGVTIVADCGHGAAYKATPCALRELGANVIVYGNKPDGTNINNGYGSMHPEQICQRVLEHDADIGIAHDGDADRVILCDEKGRLIDGDDIMAIAALEMLSEDSLAQNTIISTVMSNAGLDEAINAAGGKVIRTPVGDKHVIDKMRTEGYNFGGEQSGHLIFGDHATTGDGLVAALQILRIMTEKQKPLSELAQCWSRFPQKLTNLRVTEKKPFEELDDVLDLVNQAETELGREDGRVLLRYSGTEPKVRLLLEGKDAALVDQWSEKIIGSISSQIGQ